MCSYSHDAAYIIYITPDTPLLYGTYIGVTLLRTSQARTRHLSHLLVSTDSAASATAYSCAIKVPGAIGIDEDGDPCIVNVVRKYCPRGRKSHRISYRSCRHVGSPQLVLRKLQNVYALVEPLSRMQQMQPCSAAAFASHVYDCEDESVIAKDLVGGTPLGPAVNILLGGGARFFLPNTTKGSSRPDDTRRLCSCGQERLPYRHKPVVPSLTSFRVPDETRQKLDPKSVACIMLGYLPGRMYCLWDPVSRRTHQSRDVIFDEGDCHRIRRVGGE